jgi:DnaJ-class molecular chaperone
MVNYYEELGINYNASNGEILKAFKEQSLKYHPDKNGNSSASNRMFQIILDAKNTLLDKVKRKEHNIKLGIEKLVEKKTNPFLAPSITLIIGYLLGCNSK